MKQLFQSATRLPVKGMAYVVFALAGLAMVAMALGGLAVPPARAAGPGDVQTNGSHEPGKKADKDDEDLTAEQKFRKRYPQPTRAGHLIGLPLLDDNDSTIGYVRNVVRGADGKLFLIVPYSAWFGWADTERGKRPVAVPVEAVAILARQLIILDMSRDDFDEAPAWAPAQGGQGGTVPPDENILVALGRR